MSPQKSVMFWNTHDCMTIAGPDVFGELVALPRSATFWKSSSSFTYALVNQPSIVSVRRRPRSSSTYWTCARCCAKSSVPDSWPAPTQRPTDAETALVNSAAAGAEVGLFGLLFKLVRSVWQAVATNATAPTATEIRVRVI